MISQNKTENANRAVKPFGLRDNRNLSPREHLQASKTCEEIRSLVANRERSVAENHLDREFSLPAALWSVENRTASLRDYQRTYRRLIEAPYEEINRLRHFVHSFTGYELKRMSEVGSVAYPSEVPIPLDEEVDRLLAKPDVYVDLWMAALRGIPQEYVYSPPRMLGEIGWDCHGVIVNHDTHMCQERMNLLYESGILNWLRDRVGSKGCVNILEIGGGYGALAYALKKAIPNSNYWICDLPESLLFSALYLRLSYADCPLKINEKSDFGFSLIPNYMFPKINEQFNLVVNTLSFSEMSRHQLEVYAEGISNRLADGGVLFEQNMDNSALGQFAPPSTLRKYFRYQKEISGRTLKSMVHGVPNLWSNCPIVLKNFEE
jgi:hypothetical protein